MSSPSHSTSLRGSATPPPVWVHFVASKRPVDPPFTGSLVDGRISRYKVDRLHLVRGRAPIAPEAGWGMVRVESRSPIRASGGDVRWEGVTQHLGYTPAASRDQLDQLGADERGTRAVLIALTKSPAWWRLAQDERALHFHDRNGQATGHTKVGLSFAERVHRRLYHCRYLPGAAWDFLTYFEFEAADESGFLSLLEGLRDPHQNPEWHFVERELEIWLTKA